MVTNFDGKKTIRKGIKKFNTFDVRFHIGFEIELPLEAKKNYTSMNEFDWV